MIYPRFLKENGTIGVTAPSAGSESEIDIKRLDLAISNFNKRGYRIVETPNCRQDDKKGASSSKEERAKELNNLFQNKDVDVIIGMAGGEFLLEILPYIDWNLIKENPKWLQGYSDITGISYLLTTKLDIASLYATNFRTFSMKNWHPEQTNALEILKGNLIEQQSYLMYQKERVNKIIGDEEYNLDTPAKLVNLNNEEKINMNGRMLGGCLDVIMNLIGTKFDYTKQFIEKYKDDGIIWFFDNCDQGSENIVRTMLQFKQAGYFEHTKGIIFGRCIEKESFYNISFKEAIKRSIGDLNIPIILDADIGHIPQTITIINGAIASVKSKKGKGSIKFSLN